MAATPSADLVGNSFVNQYYNVLHQSPSVVHRFYTDDSKVTRDFGTGTVETLTSQGEIHEKFMAMDFSECKAEIKSVDAQNSLSGGVILMVTGILSIKSTGGRSFVQTFFLAPQEKGYFVLNDAFRYVDEGVNKPSPYAMANGVAGSTVSSVPETDEQLEADLVVDDVSGEQYVVEDSNRLAEVDDELLAEPQVIDEPVVEAVPEEAPAPVAPVAVAVPDEFHGEPARKSYASIVHQLRMAGGAFAPKPALPKAPAPQVQQSAPAAAAPAHETEQETPSDGEGDKRAVYVKNLPVNISEVQIEAEFKRFGPLKPGGIQVRTQKQQNGCFAFIEFEDAQSAANAIEASGIQINGRSVHIEEKKVAPGGPRRFSERSGGRGGGRNFYGGGGRAYGDREGGGGRGFNEPQREGTTTTGRGFGRRTEIAEEGGFRRYENQRQRRSGSGGGGGGRNNGPRNVE